MKSKIGEATCDACGYSACDVGLDKNGDPYLVCWGKECDGAQYFSKGRRPRVAHVLKSFRPLPGFDLAALRDRYKLDAPADELPPAPDPKPKPGKPAAKVAPPKPAPAPDPAPVKPKGRTIFEM